MATFGASAYADGVAALSALVSKAIASGYAGTAIDNVSQADVTAAVLASLLNDNMVAPGGIAVGSGTQLTKIQVVSATLTPAAVAANTAVEQTFTAFTGLTTADFCVGVEKPTAQGGLVIGAARIVAADNLGIHFGNVTGSAITPTAGQVYKAFIVRS